MEILERFLKYVSITSTSDPDVEGVNPTAQCEFDVARVIESDLIAIGAQGVRLDDKCYVYAHLDATPGYEAAPRIGFIAHMDTAPDFNGVDVKPIIHEDYDGGDIQLNGRVIKVADFPWLPTLKGRTLITADGTTLLGADDKAGVAEIVAMLDEIIKTGMPHGYIGVCFTPDEEVGAGPNGFDIAGFGCDYAYTVDGGAEGGIEYENFNAAGAKFTVKGFNVHPGSAKDTMINAALVAIEINSMLPACDTPSHTDGYEGFFHLGSISGSVESAELGYIVRDHSAASFDARLQLLRHIEKTINEKYGEGTVQLTIKQQYRNMAEKIAPCMHLIENAREAIRMAGMEPYIEPIRGGTDGARLSYMGLPCPNLATGGYAYHGPYEHITLEGMEKSAQTLLNIVKLYAEWRAD